MLKIPKLEFNSYFILGSPDCEDRSITNRAPHNLIDFDYNININSEDGGMYYVINENSQCNDVSNRVLIAQLTTGGGTEDSQRIHGTVNVQVKHADGSATMHKGLTFDSRNISSE